MSNTLNISQDKLQNVAGQTGDFVNLVVNQGVKWIDNYLKHEKKYVTNFLLKQKRREFKRIGAVLDKKPVISLFGASQVGKSYMANNLLYNSDNKLLVYDHVNDQNIDFIKYINPEGHGNEATSAVTRFTADRETDKKRLPVKLKLFNPKDIVTVICDTYFYDYNDKGFPSKDDVKIARESILKYKGTIPQSYITDDDVYEIQEYLEKYFPKEKNQFIKDLSERDSDTGANFWDILAYSIQTIDSSNWVHVFKILWNNHEEISELFNLSIQELSKIKFSKIVFTDFNTINRSSSKAIISTKTLDSYFADTHFFQIQLPDYQSISIEAGKLCFLTAEIVLSVSQGSIDNRSFIKHTDIIDFPGARSRPEIRDLTNESRLEMLLRGKVSYLFNEYSINRKSNILSACMRTAQTNVTTMPRLINQWIDDNIGNNASIRTNRVTGQIPPLFVIFTWWNTQLEFKKATDNLDPTERIEKLFETRYQQEIIGGYKWHDEWIFKNNKLTKFSNFYLLRDFKESENIFKNNGNNEIDSIDDYANSFTNPEQKQFHETYFKKFVDYHKTKQQFFEDPEMNFLEASTPNKDGSELIIKNLVPVASNTVSVPIYEDVLLKTFAEINEILKEEYHDEDADKQIKEAHSEGGKIQAYMNKIFGKDAFYFGDFIEKLSITEKEIYELNHTLLRDIVLIKNSNIRDILFYRESSPRLVLGQKKTDDLYKSNLEILRQDYAQPTTKATEELFQKLDIDLDELFFGEFNIPNKSDSLAEAAKLYWFETKLKSDRFKYFVELGFDQALLEKLLANLKINFDKIRMPKIIAQNIGTYVDVDKKVDEAEDMIAHITSGIINEYVNSVGWSFLEEEEKKKIQDTNIANNLSLQIPDDEDIFVSLDKVADSSDRMSVEKLIDFMDELNENLEKTPLDMETIKAVPMIKNYRRWRELLKISFIANCKIPTYDINANRQLGEILELMKKYNFSIQ